MIWMRRSVMGGCRQRPMDGANAFRGSSKVFTEQTFSFFVSVTPVLSYGSFCILRMWHSMPKKTGRVCPRTRKSNVTATLGQRKGFVSSWAAIANRNTKSQNFSPKLKRLSKEQASWTAIPMIDGLKSVGTRVYRLVNSILGKQ